MQSNENQTTTSNRRFGGVLLRAVLIVLVALAAAEGLARLPQVQRAFEVQSLGNYHYQFELKWFQLERYVEANGGVDVLFLGSSLVNSGIEPEALNQAWTAATGEPPLRAFNFGVEGLTIEPNSAVARLLVETYHPRAIVFGTEIRDYAANNGVETAANFLSDPWVQYRLNGKLSLRGWLAEHSAAYRYYLAYRNWMTWDFAENQSNVIRRMDALTAAGYDIENRVAEDPHKPPDPADPEDAEAFEVFAEYRLAESRRQNLAELLRLHESGEALVLIVEMPVVSEFYQFFPQGAAAHEEFVETVAAMTEAAGSYFLPAMPQEQIPENGYSDRVHVNKFGAPVLSAYIGEWLAELHTRHGLDLRQGDGP